MQRLMNTDTLRTTLPGLYVGVVQETGDLGRIKVSVPSVFYEEDPEYYAWARPCFPYAHFFVPEVGDKVWLAFEQGDPTAPVWLGVWYPEGEVLPEADVSPPVKRVIQSPSGHKIIMDDTDGDESLVLEDKSGNRIELRGDGVTITCLQDLTIDASGRQVIIKASLVDIQQS